MNFGHKIVIAYILFIGFIVYLAVQSFKQQVDLVAPNYYEKEIKYQQQIDKLQNAEDLEKKISINVNNNILEVIFPFENQVSDINGTIEFFRPSDQNMDYTLPILTDSFGKQNIDVSNLTKGSYILKIEWENENKPYYFENKIFI
jgi:nitrogen fixation protein FixH